MNKELAIPNKLDIALTRKQGGPLLSLSLFSSPRFASGSTGEEGAQFKRTNIQEPYETPKISELNRLERLAREHQMREEESLGWKDNIRREGDLTDVIRQEKTEGKFQRSSGRAMSGQRIESSRIFFEEHFIFNASSNTCSLCISAEKIYCPDVKFHHLLESFAAHVNQAYFKDQSQRLKLIYPFTTEKVEFSLGLYRSNDPTKPQVHIYHEGKMFKYEDISFVKDPTKSFVVAQCMINLLSAPLSDIQKTFSILSPPYLTDILKFLMLTHVAETYRPAEYGPLTISDCSAPSKGEQSNSRILSRTPGSGKLTRGFLDLVRQGDASFSIDSLKAHLPFVSLGGTAVQRKFSLGLISPSAEVAQVACEMSKTSEEFITSQLQQLKEGEEKVFDLCLGSSKIDFTVQKNKGYYQCQIMSIDGDLYDPFESEITCTQAKEFIEKSITINMSDCIQLIFKDPPDFQRSGYSM